MMPKNKLSHRFAVFLVFLAGVLYTALMASMAIEDKLDFSMETMMTLDGLMKV